MKNQRHPKRLARCQEIMVENSLDALALNPGPNLSYLTGLEFHLMERPVVGIFLPEDEPLLILPELEMGKLSDLPYPMRPYPYTEDRSTWPRAFENALQGAGLEEATIGIIPRRLRVLELRYLQNAAPAADVMGVQNPLSALRIIKDDGEVQSMQTAVEIAECAFQSLQSEIKAGITEKELSRLLISHLLEAGSDPALPFSPIVSFASNSANPHAAPTDRPLQPGQAALIDWGANHDGYCSDITRMLRLGKADQEFEHIARVVREANRMGRALVKPGAVCADIDQGVRKVIEGAGYGKYFIHRTGHGLGREAHEEPYISADDHTTLKSGMTFTIEPGIYLPGRWGVRLEDDVVVTENGCRSLSQLPRDAIQL